MTQQKHQKKNDQSENRASKEALAVLCRLREAYIRTALTLDMECQALTFGTPEHKAFRAQVDEAIDVLTTTLYGPRPQGSYGLCQVCHLHYATQTTWFFEDEHHHDLTFHHCCPTCSLRLQREHTLLTEQEVNQELGL